MSDELLDRAEREATYYDKKANAWTTGVLIRDLAARVRELEAERDKLFERIEDLEWENKGIAEWREFGMECLAAAKEQRERADALRERIVGMEEGRRLAGGSSHD